MRLSPLRFVPLRWKRAAIAALSSRRAPLDFPGSGPRLIIALAADYGNLGDVALTRALVRFGSVHLPGHTPYLLCASRVLHDLKGVAASASSDDVIAIVGGGNMGDLYPDLEDARLRVVRAFPRNRIVSFPQSIDFSNGNAGRKAIARSRATYESHSGLTIFARDAESHRRMRGAFPRADVLSAPDTVLSMPAPVAKARDIPLIVCLRQDKEAGLSAGRRDAIQAALAARHTAALITDTLVPGSRLDYPAYDRRLDVLLGQFSQARCVVTDRLHGMIFSVITCTPCVVIENNNHKIRDMISTWLPKLSSIRLLTNPDAEDVVQAVDDVAKVAATRPNLEPAFAPLAAALRG